MLQDQETEQVTGIEYFNSSNFEGCTQEYVHFFNDEGELVDKSEATNGLILAFDSKDELKFTSRFVIGENLQN